MTTASTALLPEFVAVPAITLPPGRVAGRVSLPPSPSTGCTVCGYTWPNSGGGHAHGAACWWCRPCGCRLRETHRSRPRPGGRLELACRLGADAGVRADETDAAAEVVRLTDGRGADVAAEIGSTAARCQTAVRCLSRKGGQLSLIGNSRAHRGLAAVVTRELSLLRVVRFPRGLPPLPGNDGPGQYPDRPAHQRHRPLRGRGGLVWPLAPGAGLLEVGLQP